MKNVIWAASTSVLIALGTSTSAYANSPEEWAHCDFQVEQMTVPGVVDGARATPGEMAAKQEEVASYVERVITYLDGGCAFNGHGHRRLLSRAELAAEQYNNALNDYRISAGREAIASVDRESRSPGK